MRFTLLILPLLLLLTAAAGARAEDPAGVPAPPYNIVLVSFDSVNLHHMSTYGYQRRTTPTVDHLAKTSVKFTNMITPAGWTVPSYASLMTGQFQLTHGVDRAPDRIPDSALLLAEVLQEQGYRTAMFTELGWLTERFGIQQGFDDFQVYPERFTPSKYVDAANWVHENAEGQPFFLFLYSNDVHLPYRAVDPEQNPFVGDKFYDPIGPLPIADRVRNQPEVREEANGGIMPHMLLEEEPSERDTIGLYIAQYDAGLRYADQYLRLLVLALETRGLMNNTIVIFTSDHGQSMTEHGRYFEHSSFFENIVRVPFVMQVPGIGKKTLDAQAQLVDVAPTLLDLNNIPVPDAMTGRSFAPLLRGEAEEFREATYVFGDIWGVIRTPDWKLVLEIIGAAGDGPTPDRRMARNYLFNLRDDPGELNNLYESDDPAIQFIVSDLRDRLYAFMAEHRSGTRTYLPRDAGGEGWTAEEGAVADDEGMDEETRERLRSLGYLQ